MNRKILICRKSNPKCNGSYRDLALRLTEHCHEFWRSTFIPEPIISCIDEGFKLYLHVLWDYKIRNFCWKVFRPP